jgi:hypothetical protein
MDANPIFAVNDRVKGKVGGTSASLYVQPHEKSQGRDQGSFREWGVKLVAGSFLGHDPFDRRCANHVGGRQDAGLAGRRSCDRTDRPICFQRLDLVAEPGPPSCTWFNSNR